MTTATIDQPLASTTSEASPDQVREWLASGRCVLVDVREGDEHARERIAGATLAALSRFDPGALKVSPGQTLVLHCKSGRRSADAASRCAVLAASGVRVLSMTGGIEAWKAEGLPVVATAGVTGPAIGVMRQTQIAIGLMVLIGLAVGWFVHPAGFLASAFMGAGLVFAGLSGTCGLALVLEKMPWNAKPRGSCGCGDGSCGV
jgi:rhodanese-related sulfurtransferase